MTLVNNARQLILLHSKGTWKGILFSSSCGPLFWIDLRVYSTLSSLPDVCGKAKNGFLENCLDLERLNVRYETMPL